MRQWDGRRTRMRIAKAMLRYQELVPAGSDIVVEASLDPVTKRWLGPEGVHVHDLIRTGMVEGTAQAAERKAKEYAVASARGAFPTDDNPAGHPDFLPRTNEQIHNEWHRVLAGGLEGLQRMEAHEARADRAENAAALNKLAEAISGAGNASMAQMDPEVLATAIAKAMTLAAGSDEKYPGSQAAGSGRHRLESPGKKA